MQLISAVQSRTKMKIRFTADETQPVPEDVHIAFYRITQEALNNIVKHSHASETNVYLDSKAEQALLGIQDNGQGFNMTETSSGFGLGNMRERAAMIGASLQVTSERGQGTEITVTWIADKEQVS